MSCNCKDAHYYDLGGYETCSCNTCNDPQCRQVRSDYRRDQLEREDRDYRTYLQLKSRFGNR